MKYRIREVDGKFYPEYCELFIYKGFTYNKNGTTHYIERDCFDEAENDIVLARESDKSKVSNTKSKTIYHYL